MTFEVYATDHGIVNLTAINRGYCTVKNYNPSIQYTEYKQVVIQKREKV
jgi:hypothetical protein